MNKVNKKIILINFLAQDSIGIIDFIVQNDTGAINPSTKDNTNRG